MPVTLGNSASTEHGISQAKMVLLAIFSWSIPRMRYNVQRNDAYDRDN